MRTVAEIPDMNARDKEQRNKALAQLADALQEYTGLVQVIDYLDDANQPRLASTVRSAARRIEDQYFEGIA